MKNNKPDAALVWKQLEDDLVPRLGLNLSERVVYAHLLRHSHLERKTQLRFSILWLARGVRLSQPPVRQAVRSLAAKGALRLIDRTLAGHVVEVFLPEEIHAAPPEGAVPSCLVRRPGSAILEEMNFLKASIRREAIHARERGLCFYCLRRCVARGRVLDHVVPLARGGSNSYRNLVSCCVECNSQKGETAAEDFLRTLYRLRRITSAELEGRLRALEALAAGELRPILASPAAVIRNQKNPDAPHGNV
jgi:HNH endonuclease